MEATALSPFGSQFLSWLGSMMLVWALGLIFGWMMPRPKWLQRGLSKKALFLASPPGLWLRRVTLTFHAALIVRQCWYYFNSPGTFRALVKALWVSLVTWQPVEWPKHHDGKVLVEEQQQSSAGAVAQDDVPNWYVTQEDMAFFREKVEVEPEGARPWDHMMDLSYEGTSYSAWRRPTPSGRTEYKSITITPNATAEEFMDFYLDDPTRPKWDDMIKEYSIVESGPAAQRCLVVRWKRTFPFSFISSREYVLARRLFRVGDTLYGLTKGVDHPAVPGDGKTVRCATFYSMWRCRTIPCPHGSDRPACETVLLHHEDMKIPERLAKFAVRHGMKGFFQGMVPLVKEFVAKRRIRLAPEGIDQQAYGMVPQLQRSASEADFGSEASFATDSAYECEAGAAAGGAGLHKSPSLRRLGVMMLASGVALAIARTNSSSSLASSAAAAGKPAASAAGSKHSHQHRKKHGHGHSHSHGHHGSGSGSHRGHHGGRRGLRASEVASLAAVME